VTEQVIAGRYRLERQLGGGGMSEVWAAHDLDLDREVALKLLAPQADPARFQREARAAAALAHPGICTLYAYGETDGRPFIVLEYLPRGSLEDRLADGRPLPDDDTVRIASEIAAGLAHAHARGLVHRDLKPTNVLFDLTDRAKISDFGIARIGEETSLTDVGTVLGTAAYISPEQAAGEVATAASDVYAFGVILFRMLTGRLPFEASDAISLAAMHRDRPPPPVASLRPDAPARLESIAAAALAKSPRDRPRDGGALVAELAGVLRATQETAVTRRLQPSSRRSRTAVVVVVAAILAAAGVAVAVAVTFGRGPSGTSTSAPTSARPTAARVEATASPPPESPTQSPPASRESATTTAQSTTSATRAVPQITVAPPVTATPATTVPTTTAVLPPPTVPTTTSVPNTTTETIATQTAPPPTTTDTTATTPDLTVPSAPPTTQPG
jgi:serine/threonine protein kinase